MLNSILVKRVTLKNNYKIRNWFEMLMSQVHIISRYSSNENNGEILVPLELYRRISTFNQINSEAKPFTPLRYSAHIKTHTFSHKASKPLSSMHLYF